MEMKLIKGELQVSIHPLVRCESAGAKSSLISITIIMMVMMGMIGTVISGAIAFVFFTLCTERVKIFSCSRRYRVASKIGKDKIKMLQTKPEDRSSE